MGTAPPTARECGGAIYVFHDRVIEFSNMQRMDPALVLGTVIAHEIGHVLLRRPGHSAEGMMRARWTPSDWERASLGFLLFSPPDAEIMRATISSCHAG
ncbi:MAG: hypothetical protein ABI665_07435 [Vicinamibacterales bacterium]